MGNKVLFGLILLLVNFTEAQVCKHVSLSKNFEFEISTKWILHEETNDTCFIYLKIINKKSKAAQKITICSEFIHSNEYEDCNNVKSFSTGINRNAAIHDNFSGDLIVMDLNFDGLDDFALVSDSGGNGGPTYNFYIQDKTENFSKTVILPRIWNFSRCKSIVPKRG